MNNQTKSFPILPDAPLVLPRRSRYDRITRINSHVARDINRAIILNTVRQRQPISRTQIADLTLLNKSTVSSIVGSLIDEDLLVESPHRDGGVGRNPVHLSVRQGRHFVGAIYFDAPRTCLAVVDIDGTVKAKDEIITNGLPPHTLVARCVERLNDMLATLGPHRFHGIGAGVAGIVDSIQSQVIYAANLGWNHFDLGAALRDLAPHAEMVSIENDAKASALAELMLGSHRLISTNLVFLSLGAGIGAGIAVQGRILSGTTHAAGEVGHMTVVDGGEPCPCGNTGCWELYASERAPVRWYQEAKRQPIDPTAPHALSDLMDAARAGDSDAQNALKRWGQHIGVGIGNMICTFDPEVVIVGGSITKVWDLVQSSIQEEAYGHGMFARQRTATILPTSLSDNPAMLGAAALSIRKIFRDYSISL